MTPDVPDELPLVAPEEQGSEFTAGQDGGDVIRRSILPGGIRVLTEHMPGQRSATIGAWVGVGSRDETHDHFGSTHFLEHLLFKGTASRSALDIAEEFDAVGGEANAATGKEYTCYYARVLDSDLPLATSVICDMVTSARIDESDLETERGVILEELAMNDDDPTDVAHERFAELVYRDHPLGRPIGGTPAAISAVPRDSVVAHYRAHYRPDTLVISAAGGVNHDHLCESVLNAVAAGGWDTSSLRAPAARRDTTLAEISVAAGNALTISRTTEQANVILGGAGITSTDPRRFALSVLSAILGGGMSSRLFQEVREKRGLAYSVYSFGSTHADAGSFGLYAGCAPSKVRDVIRILGAEWDRIAGDGITPDELKRAVGQLRGSLVLGMEDSGSRMNRLGKAELVTGELMTLDESLERVSSVTAADVNELAQVLAATPRSLVVVGPFHEDIASEELAQLRR